MKMFQYKLDKQLEFNKSKNLFYDGIINSLKFTPETIEAIEQISMTNIDSE
jgi:hypothetical protein